MSGHKSSSVISSLKDIADAMQPANGKVGKLLECSRRQVYAAISASGAAVRHSNGDSLAIGASDDHLAATNWVSASCVSNDV